MENQDIVVCFLQAESENDMHSAVTQIGGFTTLNISKPARTFTMILLYLFFFAIISQEAKSQAIVPDFMVVAVSDGIAFAGAAIASDDENNFTVIYAQLFLLPRRPVGNISGQSYDGDGAMQGDNILINKNIFRDGTPAIDMNDSGSFIVSWGSSAVSTVYCQRFNSKKEAQDENSVVGTGGYPDVGVDGEGNFAITWVSSDTIYCQRYNNNGETFGARITVSDNPDGLRLSLPKICMDDSGNFVIVWQGAGYDFIRTYFQRYAGNGEPLGSNTSVDDDGSASKHASPAIDIDDSGNFVVVWIDDRNGGYDIYCQRFYSNGEQQGGSFKVNDDSGVHYKTSPKIAVDKSGKSIITWQDDRSGNKDIFGQRFSSSGEAFGNNFRINQMEEGDQESPDVALKNDRIYSTWHVYNTPQSSGVWANVLDFDKPVSIDSDEIGELVPSDFKLYQNYPNPFNSATMISFSLPQPGHVTLKVFNLSGQLLSILVDEFQQAGDHHAKWQAQNYPSGVYLCQLQALGSIAWRKLIVQR